MPGVGVSLERLEELVWLDEDGLPGRLDMCECEKLLRCPNGTISALGSEDIYSCEVRTLTMLTMTCVSDVRYNDFLRFYFIVTYGWLGKWPALGFRFSVFLLFSLLGVAAIVPGRKSRFPDPFSILLTPKFRSLYVGNPRRGNY